MNLSDLVARLDRIDECDRLIKLYTEKIEEAETDMAKLRLVIHKTANRIAEIEERIAGLTLEITANSQMVIELSNHRKRAKRYKVALIRNRLEIQELQRDRQKTPLQFQIELEGQLEKLKAAHGTYLETLEKVRARKKQLEEGNEGSRE